MQFTRALRQAAHAAQRTPLIRFVGRHEIPGKPLPPTRLTQPVSLDLVTLSSTPHARIECRKNPELTCPPAKIDHSPQPHPASPTGSLPAGFGAGGNSHTSFSSYRDSAQQHGPLRKSVGRIGGAPGSALGPVAAPKGQFFDRSELPARFRRAPIDLAEIEAVESGGAALFG